MFISFFNPKLYKNNKNIFNDINVKYLNTKVVVGKEQYNLLLPKEKYEHYYDC